MRGAPRCFNAQTGFSGVNSAAGVGEALEHAARLRDSALQSFRLGPEVGVRTDLDVLTRSRTSTQTRRDLAQAYFNYLVGVLRLKSRDRHAVSEQDIEEINRPA